MQHIHKLERNELEGIVRKVFSHRRGPWINSMDTSQFSYRRLNKWFIEGIVSYRGRKFGILIKLTTHEGKWVGLVVSNLRNYP